MVNRRKKAERIVDALQRAGDRYTFMEQVLLRHEIDTLKEAAHGHS